MLILYAELQVSGQRAICAKASYSFDQGTDFTGRPNTTVHVGLLKVTLAGEAAAWPMWEAMKFDPFRRESGHLIFFEAEGQKARQVTFYDAALVRYESIQRNDAEARIKTMAANGWKSAKDTKPAIKISGGNAVETGEDELSGEVDLNYLAETQISQYLIAKFKGHGMANLIDAIFQAKGYETYVSPPGPDGGVDILAGPAPLGFGQPRLCIQVKTGSPVDTTAVSQLGGVVKEFRADYGLLVSWQGFKQSVEKLRPQRFFSIRLWGQQEIVRELLQHYDQLPEEMRALMPLKRIWILAPGDEE